MSDDPRDAPIRAMCAAHGFPFVPSAPGKVTCMAGCEADIPAMPFPLSPLSALGQGAAQHHELVLTYEAHGFSRSEAMQVLLCIIQAGIMKGSGGG